MRFAALFLAACRCAWPTADLSCYREAVVQQKPPEAPSGFSRRQFLRGVGAGSVASGLLVTGLPDESQAADPGMPVGPGDVKITLNINGSDHSVSVEPRVTLLDALRNRLDLTGAKKVCDRGTCGACTVIKDGRAIYSCTALAIDVQGSKITTIEGLGTPDNLSPVQAAFVHNDAQQCGFCTPGFVVACTAMLKTNASPTAEQVRSGLGGNLCRCGTYAGIKDAIVEAGKAMSNGRTGGKGGAS
jgi:xanthine dehydrogenase YagT iron-sulfur-binding subunit